MTTLPIVSIRRDGGTQTRDSLDYATVADYADAMTEGATFPPITVYYDGSDYWLADGFHRIAAAKQIGTLELSAEVRQGSRREAILHSVGANSDHGLRRTNKDKRRAVETLLRDDEWSQWSDREIARRCSVNDKTVAKVRAELSPATADFRSENPTERTYTTKHGTTATMNTENIGRQSPKDYWEEQRERMRTEKENTKQERAFYEPGDVEDETFSTTVDDAIDDIKRYVDDTLDELASLSEKHAVVNEVLKYVRNLSVRFNRDAG